MPSFDTLPVILAGFAISTLIIVFAGIRLTSLADKLADRTGLGEALVGGVILGGATSLSGLTTSVSAAWHGFPELAISNAAGGIAGQTFFLVLADIAYRRANLEHAAASLQNMLQSALLIACLGLCALAATVPALSILSIHPFSFLIAGLYIMGLQMIRSSQKDPGWRPKRTSETREDEPDPANRGASLRRLIGGFVGLALLTAMSGYLLSEAAEGAITEFGWSEALLGTFATALITSLPELVTTIAAVRRGALTLAVGGIIGGNSFDTLFLVASDIAYRDGPIYAAIGPSQRFLITLTLVMTAILIMGLLRRERQGPGSIGFETILLLIAYLGGAAIMVGMA